MVETAATGEQESALRRRIDELEARLEKVTAERDKLRHAYEQLKGHLELIRRRIFVAQAERIDTQQLELEFAETQAKLAAMAKVLAGEGTDAAPASSDTSRRCRVGNSRGAVATSATSSCRKSAWRSPIPRSRARRSA
jgi:predicted nuclease with TOPRIM domain